MKKTDASVRVKTRNSNGCVSKEHVFMFSKKNRPIEKKARKNSFLEETEFSSITTADNSGVLVFVFYSISYYLS